MSVVSEKHADKRVILLNSKWNECYLVISVDNEWDRFSKKGKLPRSRLMKICDLSDVNPIEIVDSICEEAKAEEVFTLVKVRWNSRQGAGVYWDST
ncbi:hypothetical protein Tco_0365020 [Tanacetum coccineum]